MLTLLKGSAVAAGVLAATVTGIVFAQTAPGPAAGSAHGTVPSRWSAQVPAHSSCASR
jgi:hypothetical protein